MRSVKIVAIIAANLAVISIIIGIYNAIIFNQIRSNATETTPVSRMQASTSFWLNVVIVFIALIMLGAAVYYLFKPAKKTIVKKEKITTSVATTPPVVRETLIEKQDVVPLYQLNQPSVLYTRLRN